MGLVKAKLKYEVDESRKDEFEVQFNPAEYNISRGVNYTDQPLNGHDLPVVQFTHGNAPTLNMTLIFDTYIPQDILTFSEGGTDVTKLTNQIMKLTYINEKLHRPPIVTFLWSSISFRAVITDVKQTLTMFLSDGTPVRAKLDITFKSVFDVAIAKKKTPFESPDRTKYRTVHEGEQLWNFANQEYGAPDQWRIIAKENGIMNPLDIVPGQIIKLPPIK